MAGVRANSPRPVASLPSPERGMEIPSDLSNTPAMRNLIGWIVIIFIAVVCVVVGMGAHGSEPAGYSEPQICSQAGPGNC